MISSLKSPGKSAFLLALAGSALLAGCGAKSPQSLAEDAKASFEKKDYKTAIVQLKSTLQAQPQSVDARLMLGQSLLATGDAPGAAIELSRAMEQGADADRVVPQLAAALLRTGEYKRVTLNFAKTKLKDKDAQASLQAALATAWAGLGDAAKSAAALDEAVATSPDYAPVAMMKARDLAGKRRTKEAMAIIDKQLASNEKQPDAWVLKGYILSTYSADAKGAEAAFRKAIELDKTYVGAYFALINLRLRQRDLAGAKVDAAALKSEVPKHPLVIFTEAQIALAQGDFAKARDLSQQLLRGAPNNVGILLLAGTVATQLRELVQAETYFTKALQITPDLSTANLGLAHVYLQLGQAAKALQILKPVLIAEPENNDALTLSGNAQLALGDATAAEALFIRASKIAPGDSQIKTALALAHMAKGDADTAFAELASVAEKSADTSAELAAYAARMRRREYDSALGIVNQIAKKQPKDAMQYQLRGQVHLARRDLVQARQAFEEQSKADPSSFVATANLAALDLLDKKPEDARKRLQASVEDNPKNVYAVLALAGLLTQMDAPVEEVKSLLNKAIQIAPQSSEPRLQLIALTLRKRLYKEALVAAQEAAAALPGDAVVMDAVGRAQMEAGDVEQAISTFRKMAGSATKSGLAYTRLADIYKATGKREQAESVLRKAIEIEPGLGSAQVALVDLLVGDKRQSDAVALIKKMQRESPASPDGYALESVFHLRNKSPDEALAVLRTGLAKTGSPQLAVTLHRLLMRMGKYPDADRLAASWIKDHPKDYGFAYQVAEAAMGRRQFDEAESRLKQLLTANPDDVLVLNNLAYVVMQRNKSEAIGYAQKASDLAPGNAMVLDTLAATLAADKQLDKAMAAQKRAVELSPGSDALRLNLASLALQAGDTALARKELARLQELGAKFSGQAEVARLMKTL